MNNEKSAVEEFLGEMEESEFQPDGQNPFNEPETTVEPETPAKGEDEKLPFHKDPKVSRYIQKQIDKALKDSKPSEESKFVKEVSQATDDDDLVSAFTNIIGNDTPEKVHALKMLKKELGRIEETASQKALSAFEQRSQAERQAEREADDHINNSFEEIEELYGVDLSSNAPQARKAHNEYKAFLQKIAPKDSEGNVTAMPDIVGSFELYQELSKKQSPSSSRAKELASRSMSRSAETSITDKPKERVTFDAVTRMLGL
jgi:hypothetical protein